MDTIDKRTNIKKTQTIILLGVFLTKNIIINIIVCSNWNKICLEIQFV